MSAPLAYKLIGNLNKVGKKSILVDESNQIEALRPDGLRIRSPITATYDQYDHRIYDYLIIGIFRPCKCDIYQLIYLAARIELLENNVQMHLVAERTRRR
jgi:hypothetical protein